MKINNTPLNTITEITDPCPCPMGPTHAYACADAPDIPGSTSGPGSERVQRNRLDTGWKAPTVPKVALDVRMFTENVQTQSFTTSVSSVPRDHLDS